VNLAGTQNLILSPGAWYACDTEGNISATRSDPDRSDGSSQSYSCALYNPRMPV